MYLALCKVVYQSLGCNKNVCFCFSNAFVFFLFPLKQTYGDDPVIDYVNCKDFHEAFQDECYWHC